MPIKYFNDLVLNAGRANGVKLAFNQKPGYEK